MNNNKKITIIFIFLAKLSLTFILLKINKIQTNEKQTIICPLSFLIPFNRNIYVFEIQQSMGIKTSSAKYCGQTQFEK
jgi:hypothetical protein